MGEIGGFLDRSGRILADRLVRMSSAALGILEKERTGFWRTGVGLFQNGGAPAFSERERCAVCFTCDRGYELNAQALLDSYLGEGVSAVGELCRRGVCGLYDENRGELVFMRGEKSTRRLYYTEFEGGVCFSSRIAGLWKAFFDAPPEIPRERLWAYLCLPTDCDSPDILYGGVRSLPPGRGAICHGLGMRFLSLGEHVSEGAKKRMPSVSFDDKEALRRYLWACLYRYEAPRLSLPPLKGRERRRVGEWMRELLAECDAWRLSYLFENPYRGFLSEVGEEERIRRMGVMIQSVLWSEWVSVI